MGNEKKGKIQMNKFKGLYFFSIIVIIAGIYLYFFPLEITPHPYKNIGGIYLLSFGIVNLIFLLFFDRLKAIKNYSIKYIYILDGLLVVAFFLCIIGFMGLFTRISWYDTLCHFLVPMMGTFFLYLIFFALKTNQNFSFRVIFYFSLTVVGLIFFWEFTEVMAEKVTGYQLWMTNGDPADFRDDVLAGFFGIAAGTVISVYAVKPLLAKIKKIT